MRAPHVLRARKILAINSKFLCHNGLECTAAKSKNNSGVHFLTIVFMDVGSPKLLGGWFLFCAPPMCSGLAKFWPRSPSPYFFRFPGPTLGGAPSSTIYPGIIRRSGLAGKEQAPGCVLLAGVSFSWDLNHKNFNIIFRV